jgi:hypothetical protein
MAKRGILGIVAILAAIAFAGWAHAGMAVSPTADPLAANSTYSITVSKLNTSGVLEELETVTGATDAEGVLSFTLTHVPTKDEANFVFVTIKDGSGTVVRQGMAPAPPPGDNNATGLNYLSTTQADVLVRAAGIIGSDDPIVAAYLFIILRSPLMTAADVDNVAYLGRDALTDPNVGFESYLLSNGVTAEKLADLKSCLIYNPDNNAKTLRNYTRNFFNAVAASDSAEASAEMQKAGGFMAEIFLDAGTCSGVEPGLISAAHDAAGDGVDSEGRYSALTAGFRNSIDTAMSTFNRRIALVRISADYTNALNALSATGAQVTQYLAGVTGLMQASSDVDQEFADYYMDRDAYLSGHSGETDESVRQAMNDAYSVAWTQFQTAIAADNAAIAAMEAELVDANPSLNLPPDFGTYYDQSGATKNWPISQVVLVSWLADSTFDYGPRDNTAIPQMMEQWMGSCDNPSYWDYGSCTANGGTWTTGRHVYDTQSAVFDAYLALQEDLNILQMKKNEIWNDGNQPTGTERAANEAEYMAGVQAAAGRISGAKGGTEITAAEKDAIVKLLLSPEY